MAKITHDEILESCIKGIKKSFNEYYEWSGGEWLWNAPEYLLTVNIAKELSKIKKNKFITLEDNVKNTLESAGASLKEEVDEMRKDGRSDIVLWWAKGTPRGIIEVKNRVFRIEKIKEDLKRIKAILKEKSDIEFGVIAFYIDRHYETGNAEEKVENKINEIISDVKNFLKNDIYYGYKLIKKDDKNAAFSVALMIK